MEVCLSVSVCEREFKNIEELASKKLNEIGKSAI